ncbi:oligopeptide transporter [Naviculisporaceae sp. PSN 640]
MITYSSSPSSNNITEKPPAVSSSDADQPPSEHLGSPVDPNRNGQQATEWEIDNLLHVVDDVPVTVWLAALVGAAERFAWYGNTGPLHNQHIPITAAENYLQQSPDSVISGALGLSQAAASNIVSAFLAVSYFTPIPAAILADSWLGRYNGLVIFYVITLIGALVLFVSSLPQLIHTEASSGGVFAAMALMSIGSGGVKAIVTPFIADQYTQRIARVKVLKSGQVAVTDRTLTIRYIYNAFNWLVNVGGFAALGTTFLERYASFWAAYLGPLIVMFLGLIPLTFWAKKFAKEPPSGTIIPQVSRATACAVLAGCKMDAAKPSAQQEKHNRDVPWNDAFIDELKIGYHTCRVLILFPIYWLCLNQTFHNLISQAGTMTGSGVPNDFIKSLNPISILIFTPIVENVVYPFLTRHKIRVGPITTITVGFAILAVSQVLAAVVQHIIYDTGPCYNYPLTCTAPDNGRIPNQVSMFLQVPIYVTGGISEIFAVTTALEFAYNQSPASMRSVIQSYWLSMAGFGSLLSLAFTPVSKDPYFVILYVSLAGLMAVTTVAFRVLFRKSNVEMDML